MDQDDKVKNKNGEVMKGGGLIIKEKNSKKYLLMVYRANHNDWTFPKGHTKHSETVQETVVREVKEETGIKVEIIKELTPNKYFNTKSGEETISHMFLLRPITYNIIPEKEEDKVEWVPIDLVREKISHENLKTYFDQIIDEIKSFYT
jgi:8-oxo-dGTP pyrophosphatase MutT (NUDIX family)|tara:strand:- start:181 stop:624 length:444 start_codon:yes stop_codon:yes gene_type:complete